MKIEQFFFRLTFRASGPWYERIQTLLQNSWCSLVYEKAPYLFYFSSLFRLFRFFPSSSSRRFTGGKSAREIIGGIGARMIFAREAFLPFHGGALILTSFTPFQKLRRFNKDCNTHFYTENFLFIYTRKIFWLFLYFCCRIYFPSLRSLRVDFMPRNFSLSFNFILTLFYVINILVAKILSIN